MSTSAMDKLDNRLAHLDPGSLRRRVLEALKRFRASWVELGRFLNDVAYGGDYKEWGYDDFEVYCARELGLKKPTVQKLMVSYNYMKKYEGERLERLADGGDAAAEGVPAFQTVELLDRARRSEGMSAEDADELHRLVFAGTADEDGETALRQEIKARLKPPVVGADHIDAGEARRREVAKILQAARLLRRLLSASGAVPAGLRDRLDRELAGLEALE